MKKIAILVLAFVLITGCCGSIIEMNDEKLKRHYLKFSIGRGIAHDLIWSAGGKSMQYSLCRGRIADELMKRGYIWDGHNWRYPKEWEEPEEKK